MSDLDAAREREDEACAAEREAWDRRLRLEAEAEEARQASIAAHQAAMEAVAARRRIEEGGSG